MCQPQANTSYGVADAAARNLRQALGAGFSFLVWALILAGYGLAVYAAIIP